MVSQSDSQRGDGGSVNGVLTHEEAAQPRCQSMGCRRLVGKHRDELRAAPAARLAEDRLLAVVVVRGRLAQLAILKGPASQCACGRFHVRLGVVADAEREELHQLSGEVFVGTASAVGGRIEVNDQRGLANRRGQ